MDQQKRELLYEGARFIACLASVVAFAILLFMLSNILPEVGR